MKPATILNIYKIIRQRWKLSLFFVAIIMVFSFCKIYGAPLSSAAARIVNTTIGHDKTLLCALRDHYGFLWVGTMTGLACFDDSGENVYLGQSGVVPNTEGINVTSLFEWNDNIWFGGTRGLYIFNRANNTTERFPFKTRYGVQISSPVEKMLHIPDGKIWIITHGQGLFIFDPLNSSLTQNSRDGAFYADMVKGNDSNLYCITYDGYIIEFNNAGKALKKLRLPDFTTDKNPISMTYTAGRLWIATNRTIYAYMPGEDKVEIVIANTHHGVANSLLKGTDNQLWLGTDEGIFCYATSPSDASALLTEETLGKKLTDVRVAHLTDDSNGGMIIVTRTGISFVPHDTFAVRRVETTDGDVYKNTVNTLLPASGGRTVWLGTDHGVTDYEIAKGTVSEKVLPLGADIVVSALAEANGKLWIGSRHQGLFSYELASGKVKHYEYDENTPYALISNSINNLFISSAGELFILTNWGICRYNPKEDNFDILTETGNAIPFMAMEEDSKGWLWTYTATNDLYVRRNVTDHFSQFSGKNIGSQGVSLLFNDLQGRLWAVVDGNRLMKFDDDKEDFVYISSPVSKDYPITFLQDGDNGSLWISTNEGIIGFDPNTGSVNRSFLTDTDIYSVHGAAESLNDGSILFGSLNGLCQLTPTLASSEEDERKAYPVSISFPYNDDSELQRLGLNRLLYTLNEITLPYSDNTFTIHFASVAGNGMPHMRYQYMLEGVDPSWLTATGNEITFTRLAPGRYKLLVRADSNVSDAAISELYIRIQPPFYLSWPAFIIYTLLIIVIIISVIYFAKANVKKQTVERIKELQVRQERETYESKMKFFINLVHEIRTPLTLINLPLEQIADTVNSDHHPDEEVKTYVKSMQHNLDYLLRIINQLLDFRKAEQDSEVKLTLQPTDIVTNVADICSRFDEPLAAQGKQLIKNLPMDKILANIDPDKFDRVVMNLMGNAMKYSKSKVTVTLSSDNDFFTLSVADDGKGIPEKERDRIFETYYQIANDDVAATLGTGLGLTYAKLIARAHKGDISVCESPGGGATFCLTLPLAVGNAIASGHTSDKEESPADTIIATLSDKRLTLLFAEDNDELRNLVANTLKDRYTVITASNGEEALEAINHETPIDIIISDFMMPGIDGAELCRKVKGDINTSYIPFIMLTAKTGQEAKEEAFGAGADAFVEKPFSIKQLNAQINNIIHTREVFYAKMKEAESPTSSVIVEEAPYINKIDAEFLQNLNENIKTNIFDDEFSIDTMADRMSMSRSTFYRRMKAITGMTPVDYLKNFRLEYAAQLLDEGLRATEVSASVGFTSSSYFAKCFKAKYGITPKEYATRSKNS